MTHNDIYTKFMIEYDKANITSSYPSLTPYEVATILNKAYLALIAQKVTGNNQRKVPFEYDTKAIEDVRPLITTESVEQRVDDNMIKVANELVYSIPSKMLYYLQSMWKNNITTLVNHQIANNFKATAVNMPWIKNPVCYLEGDYIRVLVDPYATTLLSDKLNVTYIKHPTLFTEESLLWVDEDHKDDLDDENPDDNPTDNPGDGDNTDPDDPQDPVDPNPGEDDPLDPVDPTPPGDDEQNVPDRPNRPDDSNDPIEEVRYVYSVISDHEEQEIEWFMHDYSVLFIGVVLKYVNGVFDSSRTEFISRNIITSQNQSGEDIIYEDTIDWHGIQCYYKITHKTRDISNIPDQNGELTLPTVNVEYSEDNLYAIVTIINPMIGSHIMFTIDGSDIDERKTYGLFQSSSKTFILTHSCTLKVRRRVNNQLTDTVSVDINVEEDASKYAGVAYWYPRHSIQESIRIKLYDTYDEDLEFTTTVYDNIYGLSYDCVIPQGFTEYSYGDVTSGGIPYRSVDLPAQTLSVVCKNNPDVIIKVINNEFGTHYEA